MKPQLTQPVCLLMHGIPGAGKSAFARQLSERLNIAHVNSDRIRAELFDDPQFGSAENSTVWRLAAYMAETLLSTGQSVVFDMHLPTQTLRRTLRDIAKQYSAGFVVVWVQTDYETALYRATHRDRRRIDDKYSFQLTPQMHERLAGVGSKPSSEPAIVISGQHLFKTQVGPVLKKLQDMKFLTMAPPLSERISRVDHDRRRPTR